MYITYELFIDQMAKSSKQAVHIILDYFRNTQFLRISPLEITIVLSRIKPDIITFIIYAVLELNLNVMKTQTMKWSYTCSKFWCFLYSYIKFFIPSSSSIPAVRLYSFANFYTRNTYCQMSQSREMNIKLGKIFIS